MRTVRKALRADVAERNMSPRSSRRATTAGATADHATTDAAQPLLVMSDAAIGWPRQTAGKAAPAAAATKPAGAKPPSTTYTRAAPPTAAAAPATALQPASASAGSRSALGSRQAAALARMASDQY